MAQIAESFRRFGIADVTTTLLAIKVTNVPNAIPTQLEPATYLDEFVEGTRIEFNDDILRNVADIPRVRKIYKLNSGDSIVGGGNKTSKSRKASGSTAGADQINGIHDKVDEFKEMEPIILGIMALKGS